MQETNHHDLRSDHARPSLHGVGVLLHHGVLVDGRNKLYQRRPRVHHRLGDVVEETGLELANDHGAAQITRE